MIIQFSALLWTEIDGLLGGPKWQNHRKVRLEGFCADDTNLTRSFSLFSSESIRRELSRSSQATPYAVTLYIYGVMTIELPCCKGRNKSQDGKKGYATYQIARNPADLRT
ncbi:MAG: hypothetical protein D3922_16985 [Candidatus Electrothrix sp. AR1]|nr:hypothetical protein [Candidatus Electrothrix sp. AR1]